MEGKYLSCVVIMGLLSLGLLVTEIEGEQCNYNCYVGCVAFGTSVDWCAQTCMCQLRMAENGEATPAGSMSEYYCTLGCASSVCKDITTGFKSVSGEGEEVKLAVEHCNKACSQICNNKGVQVVTA